MSKNNQYIYIYTTKNDGLSAVYEKPSVILQTKLDTYNVSQ